MTRIDAIKEAIAALPDDDYAQLRQWFSEETGANGTTRSKRTRQRGNWNF